MATVETAEINSIRLKNQDADPASPATGYVQLYQKSNLLYFRTSAGTVNSLTGDHGQLANLTAGDGHTQYALLAGRAGGQSLVGGTAANDDLTLEGTSNATRTSSYIVMQPNGGNVGVGVAAPANRLAVNSLYGSDGLGIYYDAASYGIRSYITHGGNSGGIGGLGGLQIAAQGTSQSTNGSGGIHFFTPTENSAGNSIDAALTARVTILQNGNVGIGDVAPTAMLDILGDTLRLRSSRTLLTAESGGAVGEICWDESYLYICTATDTWRRVAHDTW